MFTCNFSEVCATFGQAFANFAQVIICLGLSGRPFRNTFYTSRALQFNQCSASLQSLSIRNLTAASSRKRPLKTLGKVHCKLYEIPLQALGKDHCKLQENTAASSRKRPLQALGKDHCKLQENTTASSRKIPLKALGNDHCKLQEMTTAISRK